MFNKLCFAALLFPFLAVAQAAGTITVTTSVVAVAGTGATGVSCTISNPTRPTIHIACSIGGTVVLTQDATPAVGSTSGIVGTFLNAGVNSVTWIIQQPTAGTITWNVTANGTTQAGSF